LFTYRQPDDLSFSLKVINPRCRPLPAAVAIEILGLADEGNQFRWIAGNVTGLVPKRRSLPS
jgi:hypothetical protein